MAGIVILAIVIGLALAAPLITSYNPIAQDLNASLLGPSRHHLLGTDQLGRDTSTRLLYGLRLDLRIGFIAVLLPFVLGVVLGSLAGYFGGWMDTTIMRLVDIVVAFPFYVLIIALVFVLGPGEQEHLRRDYGGGLGRLPADHPRRDPGGQAAGLRDRRPGGGLSNVRIMLRHLLPNVISQAFIYGMSDIVQVILAIVTLGFFGLGIPPPTADLGSMINDGQNFLSTHWQLATIPGLVVVVVGLGLSLVGDGLADLAEAGPVSAEPILEVRDLHVRIASQRGIVRAVDGGVLRRAPGRCPRPGGRVRLRQEHDAARDPRRAAGRGAGHVR